MKHFQSLQPASGKTFQSLEFYAPKFSNRWKVFTSFAFLFAAGLNVELFAQTPAAASAAAAKQDAPPEQIDAYVALIQADQARDRGSWKTAVQQYREAMKQYALLMEKHPNWNPEIVSFRLSYCANEVNAILKKTGKSETDILMGPAVTAEDENASYKDRFDALKRDYDKVREEAAQLRKDGSMNEAVAKNLQAEAKRLERDNNRLRLELTGATSLAQRSADDVAKLQGEITQLKLKIDAGLLANQQVLREKQAADRMREESERTGVELSKVLADTRRDANDLKGRNETLLKQVEDTRAALADRESKLAAATNEIVRAAQANAKLQDEIKATGKLDVEKYKKELELARIESDLLNKKLDTALRDAAAKGDAAGSLLKEKRALSNDLSVARAEVAALTGQRNALEAEVARNKKALGEHAAVVTTVAEQKQQIAALESRRQQLEAEAALNKKALGEHAAVVTTVAEQKQKIAALEQKLSISEKARDELATTAASAGKIQTQLNDANAEIAKQKIAIAKLEQNVANTERARDEAIGLAGNAAKISAKLSEATNAIAQWKAEYGKLEQKIAAAEAARDNAMSLSGQAGRLQTKLADATLLAEQQAAELRRLKAETAAAKAVAEKAAEDAKDAQSVLAKEQTARTQAERDLRLSADAVAKLTAENKALIGGKAISPEEVKKLQDSLALSRDEVRTWATRHESLSNTLDGVKKRMAEMSAESLARDRKAAATDAELAAAKKSLADAKDAMTTAQKRAADLEEQVRTIAATRTSDLDKQKKNIAALNETIELNQKEMERLRLESKAAKARVDQLENDNRLLMNENARLKK